MEDASVTPAPTTAPTTASGLVNGSANVTISFEEQMVAYGSLYLMAVFCIVLGSIRSVWFVSHHIEKNEKIDSSITTKEAKRFPFTASAVLFGLYVFFKKDTIIPTMKAFFVEKGLFLAYMSVNTTSDSTGNATQMHNSTGLVAELFAMLPHPSKENAMWLLLVLLCWEGSMALGHLLKPLFSFILSRLPMGDKEPKLNLPYELKFTRAKKETENQGKGDSDEGTEENKEELIDWKFDTHDIVSVLVCSLVGLAHVWKRHWITNDVIGVAFSMYGIEALHLASFKAGCLLLSGLFVYDVFWVFATEVMTTVATGVSAPILLKFPQDLFQLGCAAQKHAMLGLGDIVIPGIFVALLRRFDSRIIEKAEEAKESKSTDQAKPCRFYFLATMGAYAIGLTLTILVMHWFKAAQPALLYLVPLCVGVPMLVACVRGEFNQLWNYSEEHLVKQDDKQKEKEKAEKKTQ